MLIVFGLIKPKNTTPDAAAADAACILCIMIQLVRQRAFFDIRVFNPLAPSYSTIPLAQCYTRNEQEKRRAYDQRVRQIEHGSFFPLVLLTGGGMGNTATKVFNRIASLLADIIMVKALQQSDGVDTLQD